MISSNWTSTCIFRSKLNFGFSVTYVFLWLKYIITKIYCYATLRRLLTTTWVGIYTAVGIVEKPLNLFRRRPRRPIVVYCALHDKKRHILHRNCCEILFHLQSFHCFFQFISHMLLSRNSKNEEELAKYEIMVCV